MEKKSKIDNMDQNLRLRIEIDFTVQVRIFSDGSLISFDIKGQYRWILHAIKVVTESD